MKRLLFAIAIILAVLPTAAFAEGTDMRCFTLQDCIDARKKMLSPEEAAKNPLYQGTDAVKACGGAVNGDNQKIGFCYPAARAETRISFAGKKSFENIGDFIQYGYRFSILAASVIAVIMIIIAGFQWTASAGSADKIKSAQKRIAGAVMGLTLAILSYIILNTVNPYLVNFRLPQAWMINTINYGAEFCRELPNKEKDSFALAAKPGEPVNKSAFTSAKFENSPYKEKDALFACGNEVFFKSGNGGTCRGHYCTPKGGKPQSCVKNTEDGKYECRTGNIAGTITNTQADVPFFKDWQQTVSANDFDVYLVCPSGNKIQITAEEEVEETKENKEARYGVYFTDITSIEKAKEACGGNDPLGLVLFPDIEENWDPFDEGHFLGVNPAKKTIATDLGDKNSSFFNAITTKAQFKGQDPANFLIPLIAFSSGYSLDIDIGNIEDID